MSGVFGSPPRQRKTSIVERSLGANMLRRNSSAATNAVMSASNQGDSMASAAAAPGASPTSGQEPSFSMKPDDYELGVPIGYGSSAIVCIATYKPTGRTVAIKVIDLDMFERNQIDELRREIQIMALSKHPNLLPVYGSFVNGSKLYIVTPFLSAGSCLDIMRAGHPHGMDEGCIGTILKQALLGLEYLHRNGRIHRDVKAGNLLMDEDGTVQLADFGVSSSLMDTGERKGVRKTFVGTPCWMAPEVMEQSGYDYKADIWSFGITALELAIGHAPYAKFPPLKVLMLTLQNDPPTLDREQTSHKYSKTFKDMIDTCLNKDPAKRPTAEKLLQHSFFKQATKKKSHLYSDLLNGLPPIVQRHSSKKSLLPERDDSKGVSWDFSESDNDTASNPAPEAVTKIRPTSVRFDINPAKAVNVEAPSSEHSDATHVEDSSNPSMSPSLPQENIPSVAVVSPTVQPTPASIAPLSLEVKKGRFSVSENQQTQSPASENSGTISPDEGPERRSLPRFGGVSRFTVKSSSDSLGPPSATSSNPGTLPSPAGSISLSSQQHVPGDKRGRFEVTAVDVGGTASTTDSSASPNSSPSNSIGRGSRFTTTMISSATTLNGPAAINAIAQQPPHQTLAQLQAHQQQQLHTVQQLHQQQHHQHQQLQQQGHQSTQQSNQVTAGASTTATVPYDDRIDTILKQNEQMKNILDGLLSNIARNGMEQLSIQSGHHQPQSTPQLPWNTGTNAAGPVGNPVVMYNSPLVSAELNPYDAQILAILQENENLRKENDSLRSDVEIMHEHINHLTRSGGSGR